MVTTGNSDRLRVQRNDRQYLGRWNKMTGAFLTLSFYLATPNLIMSKMANWLDRLSWSFFDACQRPCTEPPKHRVNSPTELTKTLAARLLRTMRKESVYDSKWKGYEDRAKRNHIEHWQDGICHRTVTYSVRALWVCIEHSLATVVMRRQRKQSNTRVIALALFILLRIEIAVGAWKFNGRWSDG